MSFNIEEIRSQFPILKRKVHGKDLIYFDNGATVQKPQMVIDCINHYYENDNANIHRGVHHLSQIGTQQYEDARITIQKYLNAKHDHEIIFTKGTTDGINLVAQSMTTKVSKGDEIVITAMEHHSNIVPWQMLCERTGASLKVIPMNQNGTLQFEKIDELITDKTKIVAFTHVSNSLGTVNPIRDIIAKAKSVNALTLIDGAQAIQHLQVDVQELDCDFYIFSGHKVYGPTGVGILYGKEDVLNDLPPYQGGGDMIKTVTFEKTTYNDLPHKFEAGTPNIVGGIALGKAFEFLNSINLKDLLDYEHELLEYATTEIKKIEGVKIFGEGACKTSVLSFLVEGTHPYDVGTLLDKMGVAVRTGHHCAQPVMDFFEIPGTIRLSIAMYNTKEEIDYFIKSLQRAVNMLL